MNGLIFNEKGMTIPSFSSIFEELLTKMKEIFGPDIYMEDDSPDAQLLSGFAKAQYDVLNTLKTVYLNFYPSQAQGVNLDRVCEFQGIIRKLGTPSTCDIILTGKAGINIINGIVVDDNEELWLLPPEVTIGDSGSVSVTVTSSNPGIYIGSNGINKILTTVSGWDTVTNPTPCVQGQKPETDMQLRSRRYHSTFIPTVGVVDGIYAALINLNGVTKARVYNNPYNTENLGMPPHSVSCVVYGGADADIAQVIFRKVTLGCYISGTTQVNVFDSQGIEHYIRFYRPTFVQVKFVISLLTLEGYSPQIKDAIEDNIRDYLNNLEIGAPIIYGTILNIIYQTEPNPEKTTINVIDLKLQVLQNNTWIDAGRQITLNFNELPDYQGVDFNESV